jgi:hypothetical protein
MELYLPSEEMLGWDVARIPMRAACDVLGIRCERLEWVEAETTSGGDE